LIAFVFLGLETGLGAHGVKLWAPGSLMVAGVTIQTEGLEDDGCANGAAGTRTLRVGIWLGLVRQGKCGYGKAIQSLHPQK